MFQGDNGMCYSTTNGFPKKTRKNGITLEVDDKNIKIVLYACMMSLVIYYPAKNFS